jgi:hypothetical protein
MSSSTMSSHTTAAPPQQQQQQQQPLPQSSSHQQQLSSSSPTQSQRTAEAHTAFTASLHSVGANLDADLRARAANLHDNAAALARQEADLQRHTAELRAQNAQWGKIADQAREGLKEIGDVQNWAELIERDLLLVEETLRLVEGGGEERGEDSGTDVDGTRVGDGDGDGDSDNNNNKLDDLREEEHDETSDGTRSERVGRGGGGGEEGNENDSAKKQQQQSLWRRWW